MGEAVSAVQARENVQRLVRKVQRLPTLPSILSTINQMLQDPKTPAREVVRVISSDPVLASKVLRVVNSSFYGFPNRVSTITQANIILGFNTLKSIILSSTILEAFGKRLTHGGFDHTEFWKHSIGCGAAARTLGQRLQYPRPEELFIAGVLHDVGKIILDQFFPDQFVEILSLMRSRKIRMVEAELQVIGTTHAEIGGWLLENWNLPKGLVETTRCHHNPALASEETKLAEIVHIADILAHAIRCGSGGDDTMPALQEGAWKSLGLQVTELDGLLSQIGQEVQGPLAMVKGLA